ncbi:acetyl-CoA carboxylase biotin carboxyl carrier protein [Lactococcus protaetiae]|uniref:Biotin carboxyl carrier protein of acetyl-CoA carboxylase n=1 Tax=Lactococcus protaetiae TaxID=2592653 RepID=A0A514Z8J2_9LACT|nr:acetyl-CoA carboxylase biotin carboxyl carrier protein [Lactococcus protaetiae]QDK70909.1 acetyl-CoA carboxylase biotin carboxyl carrier protein [Lactococcus protaetiae]
MNINEVKELMKQFDGSSLREFSWKNAEGELGFSKNDGHGVVAASAAPAPLLATVPVASPLVENSEKVLDEAVLEVSVAEGEAVKSPLVGVAYLRPAPEKSEFVSVGDSVKKGQTLLIIEAMKVMNEIPAPRDGVVTEIMVSAEEVVEFGQELVRIK